jgi:hypothetical protein
MRLVYARDAPRYGRRLTIHFPMTDSKRGSSGAQRRITIHAVARAAGVSLTTVSHALNDRGVVDPVTRARVKQIAADLGISTRRVLPRMRALAPCAGIWTSC